MYSAWQPARNNSNRSDPRTETDWASGSALVRFSLDSDRKDIDNFLLFSGVFFKWKDVCAQPSGPGWKAGYGQRRVGVACCVGTTQKPEVDPPSGWSILSTMSCHKTQVTSQLLHTTE